MYVQPSLCTYDFRICAQTPNSMLMSFFLKSALMAPFACGSTAFLKLQHPLNKGLCLIHVMNVLHNGFIT